MGFPQDNNNRRDGDARLIEQLRAEIESLQRQLDLLRERSHFDAQEVERLKQSAEPVKKQAGGIGRALTQIQRILLPPGGSRELLARNVYRYLRGRPLVSREAAPLVVSEDPLVNQYGRVKNLMTGFQKPPYVSIIIPAYNCLEYTRQCVESILLAKQDFEIEIVVVDNGSTDGTSRWLSMMAERHPNLSAVYNAENRGFSAAVNQGVEASRGDIVVIANNDLLMPTNWLPPLAAALESNLELGVVSPLTNYVGHGPQLDQKAVDLTPDQLEAHAQKAGQSEHPLEEVVDRLVFFCVAIRRELYDLLGGLPAEAYGLGNFEDDDFCLRARLAGYKLAIAPTSFVFHFGSRTFKEQNISHDALFHHNRIIFYERTVNFATRLSPAWSGNPGQAVNVSVILRTQNRRRWLSQALISLANQSYRDFEVVLVNDGGEDTADLVQVFERYMKIQYIHHSQAQGRGAALNAGWRNARGRWVTYLDDDDLLYPLHLEELVRPLLADPSCRVSYSYGHRTLCLRDDLDDIPMARLPMIMADFQPDLLRVENSIPIMALMHERSLAEEIGGFDETLEVLEDWDFIIRLVQQASFALVPKVTAEYRFYTGENIQNSIIKRRSELLPTIQKIYARYPVTEPALEARREQVMQSVLEQVAELEKIAAFDGDALLKNLIVLMRTSDFALEHIRKGGFRA